MLKLSSEVIITQVKTNRNRNLKLCLFKVQIHLLDSNVCVVSNLCLLQINFKVLFKILVFSHPLPPS